MERRIAVAALLLALSGTGRIKAQSKAPDSAQNSSAFEVTSIKPADPSDNRTIIRFDPSGRFEANGVPLKLLMRVAYDVPDFRIVGLPPWADSDRFIVQAKAAEPKKANAAPGNPSVMTDDEQKALEASLHTGMRALLADRFRLKAHRETREMPVYALVIAKGGSKLKPAKDPGDGSPHRGLTGGRGELTGDGATLDMLIRLLSNTTGRTIIDRTGLGGAYDFKLEWTPDPGEMGLAGRLPAGAEPSANQAPPVQDGPSLFTAVQEQLGLRLEATKAPVEVVVVDYVEKPSAN